ncbi:hypothetical protein [Arthrobacter sp. B2I5]|uniref:hypothetical protein n=1 Tax=Arthrobacter sp. B2I5 TaxID=3042266 RepID=UPI0027D809C3|nr:hypothetical protein [Arthrobacter sp. B2I5]
MLHQQITEYLKIRYPHVLFRTDFAAGLKLSMQQAILHKKLQASRAWPDLQVAEKSHVLYGEYPGLFIELKADGVELYKKDGTLRKNEHYEEQAAMLQRLRDRGYKAEFAVGFVQARKLIDEYLTGGSPLF